MEEIKKKLQRQYNSEELYPNDRVLSSSQIVSIMKSPREFYERYILGIGETTLPMMIGTIFSEYYSGNEEAINYLAELEVEDYIIDRLKKAKRQIMKSKDYEKELKVSINGYIIRVTLDGFIKSPLVVVENKTGKREWEEVKVEDDLQLDLQAWAVWKLYKRSPKIYLHWIDLNKNAKKPLQIFPTKRSVEYLKNFERDTLIPIIDQIEDGSLLANLN